METRANYILVGSFILVLIGVGLAFVIWLARFELEAPRQYVSYFSGSVTGLEIGSPVRYRGVSVGSVSDIRIDPENVERVRVVLDVRQETPIKQDTIASIGLQGITGIAFIQLTGGTQAGLPLMPKTPGRLAEIPSETSGLEQVLQKAPELFTKAVMIADRLSKLVDDKNLSAVNETLTNLQNITGVLADRTKNLDSLFVDAGGTLKDVQKAAREVGNAANNVNRLSIQLSDLALPVGNEANNAMKDLRTTLKAANGTLNSITRVSTELNKVLAENRLAIKDFSSGGLYELSQFIAEARVLVAGLTRLSGQIEREPARFFFGDTQKGFEAK